MTRHQSIPVPPEDSGSRLDAFLARALPKLSRSAVARWIEDGRVSVPGRPARKDGRLRPGMVLKDGDVIEVDIPDRRPPAAHLAPESVPLDILYEDTHLLVVNKPSAMSVHPGAGRQSGTLVNALLGYTAQLSPGSTPERPGIVHRLDKDTTGLLLVARTDEAHRGLALAFAAREVHRTYRALVWGRPVPASGDIATPIGRDPANRKRMAVVARGGKPAATHYQTLASGPVASEVLVDLATGRTHQIRVHFAWIGHPVVGDPTYRGRDAALGRFPASPASLRDTGHDLLAAIDRQALHAWRLTFTHPISGAPLSFVAPPPADYERARRFAVPESRA